MIKANEGDYEKDGILHCGTCHKPKEVKLNVLGIEKTYGCMCACEVAKQEAERKRFEAQQRAAKVRELKRMGFADDQLKRFTFDTIDDTPKIKIARNYVDHFDDFLSAGKGLMFYGSVGTGKSVLAACIVNALTDRGYPCLMTTVTRINDAVSGMYDGKQSYIDNLNKFSLLVLDDLGAERDTEYMREVVHSVIDTRYRARLPLIVTTNYTTEELKQPNDISKARLFSRLWEMCLPYKFEGEDKRKQKLAEDFKKLAILLGG